MIRSKRAGRSIVWSRLSPPGDRPQRGPAPVPDQLGVGEGAPDRIADGALDNRRAKVKARSLLYLLKERGVKPYPQHRPGSFFLWSSDADGSDAQRQIIKP